MMNEERREKREKRRGEENDHIKVKFVGDPVSGELILIHQTHDVQRVNAVKDRESVFIPFQFDSFNSIEGDRMIV